MLQKLLGVGHFDLSGQHYILFNIVRVLYVDVHVLDKIVDSYRVKKSQSVY